MTKKEEAEYKRNLRVVHADIEKQIDDAGVFFYLHEQGQGLDGAEIYSYPCATSENEMEKR